MLYFLAGVALLMLACLIPQRSRRASSLPETEREAWVERDRLAGFEKQRQAQLRASNYPCVLRGDSRLD